MDDFDRMIRRLASAPVHPGLASMDDEVFTRIARRSQAVKARRGMVSAGALAMLLGMVSGVVPETTAAASSLPSFSAPPPLAPSALLGQGL